MIIVAPQFRAQEDFLSGDAALFNPLPDLGFNIVDPGCIDETHAILQGLTDRVDLGIGILEGAEPEGRDFCAGVECVSGCTSGNEASIGSSAECCLC